MRVGIITFINTINFGVSLQMLALQEIVESLGMEAEVFQYVNMDIESAEKNMIFLTGSNQVWNVVKLTHVDWTYFWTLFKITLRKFLMPLLLEMYCFKKSIMKEQQSI